MRPRVVFYRIKPHRKNLAYHNFFQRNHRLQLYCTSQLDTKFPNVFVEKKGRFPNVSGELQCLTVHSTATKGNELCCIYLHRRCFWRILHLNHLISFWCSHWHRCVFCSVRGYLIYGNLLNKLTECIKYTYVLNFMFPFPFNQCILTVAYRSYSFDNSPKE